MPMPYSFTVRGQFVFESTLLDCRTCGANRGLTFTTSEDSNDVTASCPQDHLWTERRVPAFVVREQAIKAQERS